MTDPRCGYTVLDGEGIEQPCDRPATEWRWYQDVEHEDCLEPACDWHANDGGWRIHRAEAAIERVRELPLDAEAKTKVAVALDGSETL